MSRTLGCGLPISYVSIRIHLPPFYHTTDDYSVPSTLLPVRVGSGLIKRNASTFLLCFSIMESIILSPFLILSIFQQGLKLDHLKHMNYTELHGQSPIVHNYPMSWYLEIGIQTTFLKNENRNRHIVMFYYF